MGNLTRDPDLRQMPNGSYGCKFGVATSRVYTAQDGSRKEETTFVDVDAFGRSAELIGKHFNKGKSILMEGRLRLDQWDDPAGGGKRTKLCIVLETFQFVGTKQDSMDGGQEHQGYGKSSTPARSGFYSHEGGSGGGYAGTDAEEDVPF